MADDFENLINPQGNLIALKVGDVDNAINNLGYSRPAGTTKPIVGNVAQPEGMKMPEFIVPDDPSFVKAINKETGKTVLLKRDELGNASSDQYDLYSKENEDRALRVQSKLSSLKGSPWYESGSSDLDLEHAKDDILTADGKYKLQGPDNKPLDLDPKAAIEALKNPSVKFRDPKAQELYEAQLLYKSTQTSRITGAAKELNPAISEEEMKDLVKPNIGSDPNMKLPLTEGTFASDRMGTIAEKVLGDTKFRDERLLSKLFGTGLELYLTKGEGLYGEVGAASKAEAAIASRFGTGIVPTLAKGAVGGAIVVSPQVIAQAAIDKDLKGAAETLALGAGGGSLFALGGKAISSAVSGARTMQLEGALEKAAAETGLPALDKTLMGTADQQAGFLKKLGEEGAAKAGQAEKTIGILDRLAAGSALEGAANKLSAAAERVPVTSVMAKIEKIGEDTIPLVRQAGEVEISRPMVGEFNAALEKMADKSGTIALSDMVKAAQSAGEKIAGKEAAPFYRAVNETLVNDAIKIGTSAAEKADAKLASEWSQAVYNQQVAKALPRTLAEFEARTAATTGSKAEKDLLGKLLSKGSELAKSKAIHYVAGAIGHAVGGPVGGIATYGLSSALEKGADKLAESYIANPKNASKMTGWLAKQKDNPNLASYLVLDAKAANAAKIKEIPMVLQAGTIKAVAQSNPIKEILGDHANGLSKEQQFNKLSQQLANLSANDEVRQVHLKEMTASLKDHPQLQSALVQDMENKIQYLYNILPKNPNAPQPFMKQEKWNPTPAQIKDFEENLKIAQDPYVLVEHIKNGSVTSQQVATASALNPAILQEIRNELKQVAYSGKVDLNQKQRLAASLVMGENVGTELNKIPQLQAIYGQQQQAQGTGAPPPAPPAGKKGGGRPTGLDKLPSGMPTTSQRIANK